MIEETEHKSVRRNLSSTVELDAESIGSLIRIVKKYSPDLKDEDQIVFTLMTKEKKYSAKIDDINELHFEFYKKIDSFSILKGKKLYGSPFHLDFSYSKSILGNITLSIESENATSFANEIENLLRHRKCWYDAIYTKTMVTASTFVILIGCFATYETRLYISKHLSLRPLWNEYSVQFIYAIFAFLFFMFFLIRKLFPMYKFNFGNEKKRLEKLKNFRRLIIGIPAILTTAITILGYLPK